MVKNLNTFIDATNDPILKKIRNSVLISLNKYPILPRYAEEIIDTVLKKEEVLELLTLLKNHDEYTYKHSINVAILSFLLGLNLGYNREELIALTIGALLHDIGKTRVPLNILNKPGRLTSEEFDIIRIHSTEGYKLIENTDIPNESKNIVLYHHIRLDGSGYPRIPEDTIISGAVQIVSLCDVFDALTGDRSYKPGMSKAAAYRIIHTEMSNQLNLTYLDALLDSFSMFDVGDIIELEEGEKCKVIALNIDALNRPVIQILEGPEKGKIIDLNIDIQFKLRYT